VAERLPEYPFLVVGRDYLFPDEQLPKNIEYIGQLTDMKAFYEQISVLLVPSIVDDAFPRVILEAAVNGIPVVANKIGGIPEAMGESGIIVDAGPGGYADAGTVAAKYVLAIRKLFGDDQRYEYESKRALIRAREYQRAQDEQITRLQATFGERVSVTTATAGSTHEIDC
jgi:glycosyltransferase involved in cell wall biosynthesis